MKLKHFKFNPTNGDSDYHSGVFITYENGFKLYWDKVRYSLTSEAINDIDWFLNECDKLLKLNTPKEKHHYPVFECEFEHVLILTSDGKDNFNTFNISFTNSYDVIEGQITEAYVEISIPSNTVCANAIRVPVSRLRAFITYFKSFTYIKHLRLSLSEEDLSGYPNT